MLCFLKKDLFPVHFSRDRGTSVAFNEAPDFLLDLNISGQGQNALCRQQDRLTCP